MEKKLTSLLTVTAIAITFVFCFAIASDDVYVSAKSKKYHLPKEISVTNYGEEDDSFGGLANIKYDKYGNMKFAYYSEAIPSTFKIKYRNKKGVISSVTIGEDKVITKKTYDKKGRVKTIKTDTEKYKIKSDKKGIIKKVTLNGKKYYSIKKIKFHKNGFVSSVTYSNGNVNKYNKDGLLTSIKIKGGKKYTYKYTKKKGKIVKIIEKCDGKKTQKVTLKYGKATTKDLWKFSCVVDFAGGPSNATELYAKAALSGVSYIDFD